MDSICVSSTVHQIDDAYFIMVHCVFSKPAKPPFSSPNKVLLDGVVSKSMVIERPVEGGCPFSVTYHMKMYLSLLLRYKKKVLGAKKIRVPSLFLYEISRRCGMIHLEVGNL